jgi:hypothetical protein
MAVAEGKGDEIAFASERVPLVCRACHFDSASNRHAERRGVPLATRKYSVLPTVKTVSVKSLPVTLYGETMRTKSEACGFASFNRIRQGIAPLGRMANSCPNVLQVPHLRPARLGFAGLRAAHVDLDAKGAAVRQIRTASLLGSAFRRLLSGIGSVHAAIFFGSAQESDNLPEKPAFSERWPLASLRGWGNTTGQGF